MSITVPVKRTLMLRVDGCTLGLGDGPVRASDTFL